MSTWLIVLVVWAFLTWICPTIIIQTQLLGGTRGICLAPFLILVIDKSDKELVAHEKVHVKQYRKYGWLGFYPIYFYYQWKYGYRQNPLEKEAFGDYEKSN